MLDTATLFTCLMVAELTGSAILLFLYLFWKHHDPDTRRSVALWFATFFLGGIGTFLLGMRGILSDGLTLVLANALILAGTGLRRSAVAAFFGQPSRYWIAVAIPGLWGLLCLFPWFRNTLVYRVDFNETAMVLLIGWSVLLAARCNRERLHAPRIYCISSALECCAYIGMGIYFNLTSFPSYLASFKSQGLPLLLLIILVSMVVALISSVAMVIERSVQQYRQQARLDVLTGLPNRREFHEAVGQLRQKLPADGRYAAIFFDLDNFKAINDTHGHSMGDAILRLFGSICRENLNEYGVACRLGGDEFAVYLNGADADEAETFSNRVLRRFAAGCREATDGKLEAEVSTGIALCGRNHPLDRALEIADQGNCTAKRSGKARVVALELNRTGQVSVVEPNGYGRLRPGPV